MERRTGLAGLGEFGLIEKIRSRAETAGFLLKGIGDDCSLQAVSAEEELLTSMDLLLEGVHFNLQWTDFYSLGYKSAAVNLSDIAAMGGIAKSLYLGVAIPDRIGVEQLEQLLQGFLDAVQGEEAVLAGGDTCRSGDSLVLAVTAQGVLPQGQAVCRDGARPGDLIFVSGTLGDSALALSLLQQGLTPEAELAVRHHRPQARLQLGRRLAEGGLASAMIDISDGLLGDLGHILTASRLGATLELAKLPLSEPFGRYLQHQYGLIDLALTGGEDYELLFTVPPERKAAVTELAAELLLPLTCIGRMRSAAGLLVLDRNGERYPCTLQGFDHFSTTVNT